MGNIALDVLGQKQAQTVGNRLDNVFSLVKNASNPSALLESMISRNPRYSQAIAQAKRYGANPTEAFYAIAKEKGIADPDAYLAQIRSRLGH